jgi:hypothetical protein
MEDVNAIVQDVLGKARRVIEAGGHWSPMLFFIREDGVETLAITGMGSTGEEKQRVATMIDKRMKDCGATLAILIMDVWIAERAKGSPRPRSVRNDPGRTEALTVTLWGPKQPTMTGMQSYSRDAKGKPVFGGFSWQDRSSSRFAGDDVDAGLDRGSSSGSTGFKRDGRL